MMDKNGEREKESNVTSGEKANSCMIVKKNTFHNKSNKKKL